MNPPAGEELGKTSRTVVEALKVTPSLLVLVIFSIAVLVLIYVSISSERDNRMEMTKILLQSQQEAQKLLASCQGNSK
jgi:hypothetical protein